jgi:hypothetical protein
MTTRQDKTEQGEYKMETELIQKSIEIISEVDSFLGIILVVLGGLDIVATFFLPQVIVLKIPKYIRLVNAIIKMAKYMQDGFQKLEESKGGFTLKQEDTNTEK